MQSDWCNRELEEFTRTAHAGGNLRVGNLQRVVKVLRLPVERALLPGLLDEVLGGQFYRVDPASGRARDLLVDPGGDAPQVFRARVDDLAQDVSRLLEAMATGGTRGAAPTAAPARDTIFLAWTTTDLTEERERLRRELEAQGYAVVPTELPPLDGDGVRARVTAALRDARVAVHLIGAHYGFVPEGERQSIVEMQCDGALYQAADSKAARIFWIAPGVQPVDPRVAELIGGLQKKSPAGEHVDVLANQTIESLKTLVMDRLTPRAAPAAGPGPASSARVYLVCDQLDRPEVAPIQDFLFEQSFEVTLPLFDGDAEEIRSEHYETLKECDGVLIFWGKARESWVRTMLRDLNKVFGLGRAGAFRAASLYLAGLPDANKESFRTREVTFIRPAGGFDPVVLRPFVSQLSGTS